MVKSQCFYCRGHRFNPWSGKFCMAFYGVEKEKEDASFK